MADDCFQSPAKNSKRSFLKYAKLSVRVAEYCSYFFRQKKHSFSWDSANSSRASNFNPLIVQI